MRRGKKRRIQPGRGNDSPERAKMREELLRPWPTLGYDWDSLAMHLLSREAFDMAEALLRRAVWLNPYEARFKCHLASCLFGKKKYAEAKKWISCALEQRPGDRDCMEVLHAIEEALETQR